VKKISKYTQLIAHLFQFTVTNSAKKLPANVAFILIEGAQLIQKQQMKCDAFRC